MPKTKLVKKPKLKKERSVSSLAKKVWALTREKALKEQADEFGRVNCYTCSAKDLQGANRQLGHGYSKGALGITMQYDLRILRWQCFYCNLRMGGMGAVFWKNLEAEYGKEVADKLFAECRKSKGLGLRARPILMRLIADLSTG